MTARTRRARRTPRGQSAITNAIATWFQRAALAAMTAAAITTLRIAPVQAEPRATPTRVRLEFLRGPGAEDCPDERFLRAQTIRRLAGVDPFDAAAPLTLTASIERQRGELAAALFLRDRSGRGLWADGFSARVDCEVLVSAIALSIAVLLDGDELPARSGATPDLPAAPGAPPAPPQPTDQAMVPVQPCSPDRPCPPQPAPAPVSSSQKTPPPREASPPRETSPPRKTPPASSESFRWTAGLDVVTGLGLTPGVSLGSAMSIGARWPAWSAALEVRGLSSLSGKIDAVDMSVSTVTTNIVFCLNRRTMFACGLAELGVVRAAPSTPFDAASRLNLRAGFGVRAGIAWPLAENLSVRAHAEVVHPVIGIAILRHPGALVRERPVWSAPALAPALGIGLQANL
ncbi:hypothetical protein BE04_24925 [Sorangium cellulosum]|uniref:Uncharacterized protein n=1 Tax=Sorangium cellulosum TaxID=56 RepID=A0A150PXL0_SORCE|nr:hypothetical protein BE04_24925 [Sorangium cellulosum]